MQFQQLLRKNFFIKIESALKEYVELQINDAWLKLQIILIFWHSRYIFAEKNTVLALKLELPGNKKFFYDIFLVNRSHSVFFSTNVPYFLRLLPISLNACALWLIGVRLFRFDTHWRFSQATGRNATGSSKVCTPNKARFT